jgi:hypothetical protein
MKKKEIKARFTACNYLGTSEIDNFLEMIEVLEKKMYSNPIDTKPLQIAFKILELESLHYYE